MRDEARRLGLGEKSAGWLILEALQAGEGEWGSVAEMLVGGEGTLLLPRDPPSVFTEARQLSASFAFDHTLFNGAGLKLTPALLGQESVPMLTLSGLRGSLNRIPVEEEGEGKEYELTLQSFVAKGSLKDSSSRQETIEALSPLPALPTLDSVRCKYPSFNLTSFNPTFPLPAPLNGGGEVRRVRSNSKLNVAGSRASASFASIFGGSGRDRRRREVGEEMLSVQNSVSADASTDTSDAEPTSTPSEPEPPKRTISVWVIDHLLRKSSVLRGIRKTLDSRIRSRLSIDGIPEGAVEAAATFAGSFLPSVDTPTGTTPPPYEAEPEELREAFQKFYTSIRDLLPEEGGEEGLEKVESVICEEVYDRIFDPAGGRDGYEDDALASRIAALNVLGLGLRHLGLDVTQDETELQGLVRECGAELSQLNNAECRSPKAKLEVLIRAHKVLVEGLAKLPTKIKMVEAEPSTPPSTKLNTTDTSGEELKEGKKGEEGSSADLILPLLIYTIVTCNPTKLASNLLFIQRFRAESLLQGEQGYCLVNVQAAVSFLENVDVKELGLDAGKVIKISAPGRVERGVRGVGAALRGMISAPYPPPNVGTRVATDYSTEQEQTKDAVVEQKISIGDRLASLSMLGRGANLGLGHPSGEGLLSPVSPRAVSRDLPGPPPPVKPSPGRTASYLATQLNRITAPRSTSSTSLAPVRMEEELPASLRSPYPPLSKPPTEERPLHVVLASTGSVASVKIPLIVEALLGYANVRVQVVATDNSLRFYDRKAISDLNARFSPHAQEYGVRELAEENRSASRSSSIPLSSSPSPGPSSPPAAPRVHLWQNSDEWSSFQRIGDPILHIELRRWADIVLIAPCSANTLAKLNAGICDDLLTSFMRALGKESKVILFPAMNTLMYLHPHTSRHLRGMEELGYEVRGPIEKKLACGDLGVGAMVEWGEIVQGVVEGYGLVKGESEGEKVEGEEGEKVEKLENGEGR